MHQIRSELAATVWKIERKSGDVVAVDDPIVILESMKMEIPISSPVAGRIQSLHVAEGDIVSEGQVIAVVE